MIVAVDIGSGSVRAGLVTEEGVAYVARRPGALRLEPGPLVGLDLAHLGARVSDALGEVAAFAARRGIRVDTLTCTSVRYATVWSVSGSPAEASWANLARADPSDVDDLQREMTPRDVEAAGGWPTALSLVSRTVSARRWGISPSERALPLSVAGWALGLWGARPHIDDVSWADGRWGRRSPRWDLPVLAPGATVGEYAGEIAPWRGVRLAVAPPDTVAALHAFDDLRVGDAVAVAGTTTPVVALAETEPGTRREPTDDDSWLPFLPGIRLAESNAARTGDVVGSLRGLLGDSLGGEPRTLGRVGAIRSFLGPTLVAPRRLGERSPAQAIEFDAPLADAAPGDIVQSAIEANAWATNVHLRRVESQAGAVGRRIVCGGQARSERFVSLLAAAGERRVEAVSDEVALLGAAAAASGRNITAPARVAVDAEFDVGEEPSRWASRWWERFNGRLSGERVHA